MDRFAHYLRPLSETRTPRHHCFLDTESHAELANGVSTQFWRLGCADWVSRDGHGGWGEVESVDYTTPLELWVDINWRLRKGFRLCVWCHNLSFDLRISDALRWLPGLGFKLDHIALDHVASWARFVKGDATLMLCDTLSWLPAPLQQIAQDVGVTRPPLPVDPADDAGYRERCRTDVKVIRLAMTELLDMVSDDDLGPWKPTGAGQSHSAWRRRFLTERLLVHDTLDALDAEREAQWTGRCEAWQWGEREDGPFTEYDLDLAYCQIAADSLTPSVLAGQLVSPGFDELLAQSDRFSILARVSVSTSSPVVPATYDEHIVWPVGDFDTVLWDPELRMLKAAGARVECSEAWIYRRAPALAGFADWVIGLLADPAGELTRSQKRMLKHWARAMVGRCALRYREWQDVDWAAGTDTAFGFHHDWDTGAVMEMMQIGEQVKVLAGQSEAPDSLPQIPSWIMSECRRRLWHLMSLAGGSHLMYVDTDSLIVDRVGSKRIEAAQRTGELWPLHVKGRYGHLDILGPRMLTVDGDRRMSGVPLSARLNRHGQLRGEVFVSLRESLTRGTPAGVETLYRSYEPDGLDRRRRHIDGGQTAPIRLPTLA